MKRTLALFLLLCLMSALIAPAAAAEEPAPLRFKTEDREGEAWSDEIFSDYKLTMINFWEPWCPPCVGEMPDLERLYETYKSQGFLILGIYSADGMEDEVDAVLSSAGTSYPILHYVPEFDVLQTGYVPTTVFVDSEGRLVGETQIGSRSCEGWEELITGFGLLAEGFDFSTTDRDGNAVDESIFSDYALTMINFWEPWCPPCVGEMPDLERLYQDYRERGFQILGVYLTEDNAGAVIQKTGVTYPILHYVSAFDVFQTGYVPTTVFVNRWGEIVGETEIGGRDYAAWAQIIDGLLG